MRKRGTFALVAALLCGSAGAAQRADLAPFEAAMREGHLRNAAAAANTLIDAHVRTTPAGRADPVLNGIVGRMELRNGDPASALVFLDKAGGAVPPETAAEVQLAKAEAQAQLGEWRAASETFRAAGAMPLSAKQRQRSLFGLARQLLIERPREAASLLAGRSAEWSSAAERWEGEMLLAQAAALAGKRADALETIGRAWASAVEAPPDVQAPRRVALVRAALLADSGDAEGMRAMLNLAGANRVTVADDVPGRLPMCGKDGVRPDDAVIIVAYEGFGPQLLTPVALSRPGIAGPFLSALGNGTVIESTDDLPSGTVMRLRCRRTPGVGSGDVGALARRHAAWAESKGYYPVFVAGGDPEDLNLISRRIALLEERYGPDYPGLLLPRAILLPKLEARARSHGDVPDEVLAQIRAQMDRVVRTDQGIRAFLPHTPELSARLAAARTPAAWAALKREWIGRVARESPLDLAAWAVRSHLADDKDMRAADRLKLVSALVERFPAASDDPRLPGLHFLRGQLAHKTGDGVAAAESFRLAGVASDHCAAVDRELKVRSGAFDDEDFPVPAIKSAIESVSHLEFDIAPDGAVRNIRHLVAAPPLLFEAATDKGFAGYRYEPPMRGNRPAGCTGAGQQVRWVLPEDEEEDGSVFERPIPLEETS